MLTDRVKYYHSPWNVIINVIAVKLYFWKFAFRQLIYTLLVLVKAEDYTVL